MAGSGCLDRLDRHGGAGPPSSVTDGRPALASSVMPAGSSGLLAFLSHGRVLLSPVAPVQFLVGLVYPQPWFLIPDCYELLLGKCGPIDATHELGECGQP